MTSKQVHGRALAVGLLAGLLLSIARAPLGGELLQMPANLPMRDAAWRAAGLLATALVVWVWARGPRIPAIAFLVGAATGYALHGLWLLYALEVRSPWVLAGLAVLLAASGRIGGKHARAAPAPEPTVPIGWAERAGWLLAGVGVAIALEATARPLRLLGGCLPEDDSAFGSAFLALLAFGAGAFGPLVPPRARGIVAPLLLASGVAATLFSLASLSELAQREPFERFVRHPLFGLNPSMHGMLALDLLLGARVWVVPAFLLGSALACADRREQLASLLAGSATGMLAFPWMVGTLSASVVGGPLSGVASIPATRAVAGVLLAAAGAAVVAASASHLRALQRWLGAAACVGIGVSALVNILPRPEALPISPWEQIPAHVELALDSSVGLITVEHREAGLIATLDRRRITPLPSEEELDALRCELSWRDMRSQPAGPHNRPILLVGQLTPARARVLAALGATSIDRTAAWHAAMPEIERVLFQDEAVPPGEVLAPDAARRRMRAGTYGLILVPPTADRAPHPESGQASSGDGSSAITAVWLDAAQWIAHLDVGARVELASDGLERISARTNAAESMLPAGARLPRPAPLEWLSFKRADRELLARAAFSRRLARAARGSAHEDLTSGLERLYAAQRPSSPFEWAFDQVEVDERGLELLSRAALARRPDRFLEELWEDLAELLANKRMPAELDRHVAPLASAWAPWPALEVALARADFELLEPGSAAERLQRALEVEPYDLDLQVMRGWALLLAGRSAEAVVQLRAANELQPGRRDVQRVLAMAMVHAGMPEGLTSIEGLLLEDPEDEELKAYLQPGPPPPLPLGWRPAPDAHAH